MSTDAVQVNRCVDIAPVRYEHELKTFDKVEEQSPYTTFVTWARNEARKLCEDGICLKGHCHGHAEVPEWDVVEEDEDSFTCRFSAELFCRCD